MLGKKKILMLPKKNLTFLLPPQMKNEKNPPPNLCTQNLKENKIKALQMHAEPSHWLHAIYISKIVHHHFWPGLITPIINLGYLFFCFVLISWG